MINPSRDIPRHMSKISKILNTGVQQFLLGEMVLLFKIDKSSIVLLSKSSRKSLSSFSELTL